LRAALAVSLSSTIKIQTKRTLSDAVARGAVDAPHWNAFGSLDTIARTPENYSYQSV